MCEISNLPNGKYRVEFSTSEIPLIPSARFKSERPLGLENFKFLKLKL